MQDPAHRYLATVGGDVHNFQRYRPKQEDEAGPVLHLVSGGGGAFVHGTHSYVNADRDSLVRHHPDKPFYALPDVSFPSRNESFRHFAGLLVPAILRMMGNLALFAAGVLAGSLGVGLSAGAGLAYSAVAAGGWSCSAGPAGGRAHQAPKGEPHVYPGPLLRQRGVLRDRSADRLRGVPARPGALRGLPPGLGRVHRLPLLRRVPGAHLPVVATSRRVQRQPVLVGIRRGDNPAQRAGLPAAQRDRISAARRGPRPTVGGAVLQPLGAGRHRADLRGPPGSVSGPGNGGSPERGLARSTTTPRRRTAGGTAGAASGRSWCPRSRRS